jgi:hypothetical protein
LNIERQFISPLKKIKDFLVPFWPAVKASENTQQVRR